MSKPITIPNVFQAQVGPIPLSQLDADFTTVSAAVNDYQTYTNGVTDTGTVNSLIVTIVSPATFAYALFVALDVQVSNTTTSAAPTINVNSLGAKTITLVDGSSLPTGALASGGIYRLIYDGTNFRVMGSLPGSAFFANPTASVGLTAVNGSATTAMRSDAAPALSQAISPTWSGTHTFSNAITVNGAGSSLKGTVTVTAPASGATATFNGIASSAQSIVNLIGGANGSAPLLLQDGQTGTRQWLIEAGNPAVGNLRIRDATAAADRIVINNTGDVTINTPSSGNALTVNPIASTYGLVINGASGSVAGIDLVDGQTGNRQWGLLSGQTAIGNFVIRDATAGADRVSISSGGTVTLPSAVQPAFNAQRITSAQALSASTANDVVWNQTTTNQGSDYSTGTGVFTAPVAGIYWFSASVFVGGNGTGSGSTALNGIYFSKNNATSGAGSIFCFGTDGNSAIAFSLPFVQFTNAVLIQLAANDTVRVKVDLGASTGGSGVNVGITDLGTKAGNFFCGYLLG